MPQSILVVEDHARFRELICTALRRDTDFQIVEAADGPEAIQKARALQPDLILLDINLPKIHGFDVAKQIPELAPRARVIFMSQESSSDIVRTALGLGAHGYIQKMSAATDLLPAIDAALADRRFVSSSVAFAEPAKALVPRRHEIFFCSDDAAVIDGLSRCVADPLGGGDAAVVVVTKLHRVRLLKALRARGVDIDDAIARGAFQTFDADISPGPGRFLEAIDAVRAAAVRAGKAHPRVVLCGERAGRLWAAGRMDEAVALERFCDDLPEDVDIFCAYPVPYTEGDHALTRICAEHTAVSAC